MTSRSVVCPDLFGDFFGVLGLLVRISVRRLLSNPEHFGVTNMALVSIAAFGCTSALGFRHYATYRRHFLINISNFYFSIFRFLMFSAAPDKFFAVSSFRAFCIYLRAFFGTAKLMKFQ